MVLIPSPRHKLSHLLGSPHPLERDVLYGRPFSIKALYCTYKIIIHKDIYVQYTFSIYIYIYIYIYNPMYNIIILYSYIYISIGYIYNFPCRFGVRIFLLYHSACRKRRLKGGVHGSLVVKFAAARCQGPRFYLGQGRNLDRDFCSMRTTVPPLGKQLWVPEPVPSMATKGPSIKYVTLEGVGGPRRCDNL